MEFYLTPNASAYYPDPIYGAIQITDTCLQKGMIGMLVAKYSLYDTLDLPIIFVTDEDLGKAGSILNLLIISNRFICESPKAATVKKRPWQIDQTARFEPAARTQGYSIEAELNLPKNFEIPDASCFRYRQRLIY